MQHHHAVAVVFGQREIVGDEHDPEAAVPAQLIQQIEDPLLDSDIEG